MKCSNLKEYSLFSPIGALNWYLYADQMADLAATPTVAEAWNKW